MLIIKPTKKMSEKKILSYAALIFLMTFLALSLRETRFRNGVYQNGWWAVSFNDPKSDSIDFTIKNESKAKTFSWKIMSGENVIKEGSENIPPQTEKSISEDAAVSGKTVIEVSSNVGDKKEIYKILP